MKTRFAILIFVVVAFFTSGTPIQAQYPPLPRQCTDAYLEWYCFMVGQITIGKPYTPRMPEKLWFAQALAARGVTPAEMEMMWSMPAYWGTFQMGWSNLSEWQKEAARRSWRLQIAGGAQPTELSNGSHPELQTFHRGILSPSGITTSPTRSTWALPPGCIRPGA